MTNATDFEPSFERTMPRQLVHKSGPEAVWTTDSVRLDEMAFVTAGHVPRAHLLINDARPPRYELYDLALLVQLGYQSGLGAIHEFLGVPVEYAPIFMKLDLDVVDDPSPNEPMTRPVQFLVRGEFRGIERRNGVPYAVTGVSRFDACGAPRASASFLCALHSPEGYSPMRVAARASKGLPQQPGAPRRTVAAIAPERVGRYVDGNVLIGEVEPRGAGTYSCPVSVDLAHPYFFERELDHVPGVHLIETFRQAALVCACAAHGLAPAGHVVLSLNARFTEFAELELPLHCDVQVGEAAVRDSLAVAPVRLTMLQAGARVASASLRLRCPLGPM